MVSTLTLNIDKGRGDIKSKEHSKRFFSLYGSLYPVFGDDKQRVCSK